MRRKGKGTSAVRTVQVPTRRKMLSRPFIFLIRLYQRFISPLKPPSCRFTPTCSQYAVEALKEWGLIVGLALAVWRVLRCNPFSKGGPDPVPKRRHRRDRGTKKGDGPCGSDAKKSDDIPKKEI